MKPLLPQRIAAVDLFQVIGMPYNISSLNNE